jgi:IS1 family transposase
VDKSIQKVEIDELYWFVKRKPRTATRENAYIIAMVGREVRQITGFDVAFDKSPERIQLLVDSAHATREYATDGFLGYVDVVYPGRHIRNAKDKSDTHNIESVNADLRHYIPILARRSRCFPRSIETLRAVVAVFVEAYNKFGAAKMKFRRNRDPNSRELPFSVLDFL